MKIYFISNPTAGSGKKQPIFKEKINSFIANHPEDEIIFLETTAPGDAKAMATKVANDNPNETIKVFACGGDGTMSDVINGVALHDNVIFGIVPTGSCNDFLKVFPDIDFFDLESQYNSEVFDIDLIKVDDFYGLNVINIGFDAKVNYDQVCNRATCKTVKQAYDKAIISNLLKPLGDPCKIIVDGKQVYEGKALLMAFGNASYYGGGYKCTPEAVLDDGLLDYQIINKISILKFISLISRYKKGLIYGNPNYKFSTFGRGNVIEVISDQVLTVCVDGETLHQKTVKMECLRKKVHFNLPIKK